jgi:hypothetical protein
MIAANIEFAVVGTHFAHKVEWGFKILNSQALNQIHFYNGVLTNSHILNTLYYLT